MNKTVIFITFAVLAGVGLVGAAVLLALGVDTNRLGQFTTLFITVLGLASTAAGTFYALGKQGEKIETIERNTNGRLEAKDQRIDALTQTLVENGIQPPVNH